MGVPAVWEVTKRGFDERQPFSVIVTNFYKEFGRPIRIAIDAYQWVFEAGSLGQSFNLPTAIYTSKLIQNFHARIRDLISLNVSFVLVFDGRFKPNFKRNINLQRENTAELEGKDFDSEYLKFRELSQKNSSSLYHVDDTPGIAELKKELKRWNISYVEAPGEGEAEASRLQREGVVDYILSNDSDTIIFGATKILRNFSRSEEDMPAGGVGLKASDEYWCTPVDMDMVETRTGFNRWRVLLLSILTGADYNNGVKNIGKEKAAQLALSSTDFMTKHIATCPYEDFPDFATQLKAIYFRDNGLPPPEIRRMKYQNFQVKMFEHVSENLLEYFGRNEKAIVKDGVFENFPPDYVVMLYFYPLLRNDIFSFEDGSTNFAEITDPQKWIEGPKFDDSLECFKEIPPPNVADVDIWYTRILSEAYLLKHIIHDLEIPAAIEKMRTKDIGTFDLDQLSVRFKYFFPFGEVEDPEESDSKRTKRGQLKWIPKDLVPTTSRYYKEYLEREEARRKEEEEKAKILKKRSPRKKKPTQSSTLATMGFLDAPTNDKPTLLVQRRKPSLPKQNSNILEMLKANKVASTPVIPEPVTQGKKSSPVRPSLFVTESDLESDFGSEDSVQEVDTSPVKPVESSPTKIETEVKSTIQESPIKVKSRKQEHNTSPSKGDRTYKLKDLEQDSYFPNAKKKLNFSELPSSTPVKKTPLQSVKDNTQPEDVSMITVSDVSMADGSSLMEISNFSSEHDKKETKKQDHDLSKYSALENILKETEYSSDDSD